MTTLKSFNVSSNWPVSAPYRVDESQRHEEPSFLFDKCLKLHQGSFDFDPENMVEVESCVQLNPIEEASKCQLMFVCLVPNILVSRLVLVAQCRRIELFSSQGEYKLTKEGVLLDDSDPDMILFMIDLDMSKLNLSSFSLNLTGVRETCWIIALHMGLEKSLLKPVSRFNIQEMNQLLGDNADSKLSDKAREFKQLFQAFQGTQVSLLPQTLSEVQTSFLTSKVGVLPQGLSGLATQNLPAGLNVENSPETLVGSSSENQTCSNCSKCVGLIEKMEEKLINKIEEYQRIQNEKLDKILFLLEKNKD